MIIKRGVGMMHETKIKSSLIILVSIVFLLHISIINSPKDTYVYDEMYYVPAAKCLMNGTVCTTEHPPLGPAMIVGSMTILGDNSIAWRLPNIIMGTLSLVLVYLLVRRFSTEKMAFLSAFLLGFENLWFTHSSIAMIDVPATFLILVSLYFFIFEKRILAGIVMGLAMLVKEVAVVAIPAIILYAVLVKSPLTKKNAKNELFDVSKKFVLPAIIVFLLGLGVYDVAYDAFPTPFHHVMRFVGHNTESYSSPNIAETISPLRWFAGFPATPYHLKTVPGGYLKKHILQYMGQANLTIILLIWLAVPFAWNHVKNRRPVEFLHILLFATIYASFIFISFIRITFPFYMPLLIPSACILIASMLSRFPKNVVYVYCLGVLAWFIFWFPRNVFVWS